MWIRHMCDIKEKKTEKNLTLKSVRFRPTIVYATFFALTKSNEFTFISPWEIRDAPFRRLATLIKRKRINYAPRALCAARTSEKSPNQKVASARFVRSWIFHVRAGPRSSITLPATVFPPAPERRKNEKKKYGVSWKARWEEKRDRLKYSLVFRHDYGHFRTLKHLDQDW